MKRPPRRRQDVPSTYDGSESSRAVVTGRVLTALFSGSYRQRTAVEQRYEAAVAQTPVEALGLQWEDDALADDDGTGLCQEGDKLPLPAAGGAGSCQGKGDAEPPPPVAVAGCRCRVPGDCYRCSRPRGATVKLKCPHCGELWLRPDTSMDRLVDSDQHIYLRLCCFQCRRSIYIGWKEEESRRLDAEWCSLQQRLAEERRLEREQPQSQSDWAECYEMFWKTNYSGDGRWWQAAQRWQAQHGDLADAAPVPDDISKYVRLVRDAPDDPNTTPYLPATAAELWMLAAEAEYRGLREYAKWCYLRLGQLEFGHSFLPTLDFCKNRARASFWRETDMARHQCGTRAVDVTVPRLSCLRISRVVWRGEAIAAADAADAAILVADGSWAGDPRPACLKYRSAYSRNQDTAADERRQSCELFAEWQLDMGITTAKVGRLHYAGDLVVARWKRNRRDPHLDLLELPDGVAAYSAAKEADARHDDLARADGMMANPFTSAPNEHLSSWEQRARESAKHQPAEVATDQNDDDSGLMLTTYQWERHIRQLSRLTDQYCCDALDSPPPPPPPPPLTQQQQAQQQAQEKEWCRRPQQQELELRIKDYSRYIDVLDRKLGAPVGSVRVAAAPSLLSRPASAAAAGRQRGAPPNHCDQLRDPAMSELYYRLRRVQFRLLAMPHTRRSVLERCGGDTEEGMRRNKEEYWAAYARDQELIREDEEWIRETVRREKRERERARCGGDPGGYGQRAVLPACDTQYHCVVCPYVASNPEQFRGHVRQKHNKTRHQRAAAERGRFKGRVRNEHRVRQYALCVCGGDGDGACRNEDEERWVRDPAAHEWQAALGL
eukprot:COSAG01_NODE_1733_length_9368_cov_6.908620_2_plen_835_part_00